MIAVFLDTNIYVRVMMQGQRGYEMECFEQLQQLATESKVSVIVPEVVVLEFEKAHRTLGYDCAKGLGKLRSVVNNALGSKGLWNELDDVKATITSVLDDAEKEKPKQCRERYTAIHDWLLSDAVRFIAFTSDIWFKGIRRVMSGRMPRSERTSDQDSCIVESLLTVLGKDDHLYFCSTDTKDFAVDVEGKPVLHSILRDALPCKGSFFEDLKSMVDALASGKTIPEPSKEKVEEAVRRDTVRQSKLATVLRHIRSVLEEYTYQLEPSEEACIPWPLLSTLYRRFLMYYDREIVKRDVPSLMRVICRKLHTTLRQICVHNRGERLGARDGVSMDQHREVLARHIGQFCAYHDMFERL